VVVTNRNRLLISTADNYTVSMIMASKEGFVFIYFVLQKPAKKNTKREEK
jgi:hypothetical protein